MARPKRCRRICAEPAYDGFVPTGIGLNEKVTLSVDEYEVLRLIDLEGFTHEQCAMQIGVARTTVTDIYESARKKVADCLVNGKSLLISGGNYQVCKGNAPCFQKEICEKILPVESVVLPNKGEKSMRIAVTYENETIFQHFGHTQQFMIVDAEDGKILNSTLIKTNGSGHGALAQILKQAQADVLICGGIGGGAQRALEEAGIRLYGGVSGNCKEAVEALLAGNLLFSEDATCHHHEHGSDHHCSVHGCGIHSCGHHHTCHE